MTDVFGTALLDYVEGRYSEDILVHTSLGSSEILSLPYLFRPYAVMPDLERVAMSHCSGTVLDIGCGAGSHSLYLQEMGFHVTALDRSKGAIQTCRHRGISATLQGDIEHHQKRYDTLLLMMNGIGLARSLAKLPAFLEHLKSLLNPGGQILLDSSDIRYMYEAGDGGFPTESEGNLYYGEVRYELAYKDFKEPPFSWLFVDFKTLRRVAGSQKLSCKLIRKGPHFDYLARITVF